MSRGCRGGVDGIVGVGYAQATKSLRETQIPIHGAVVGARGQAPLRSGTASVRLLAGEGPMHYMDGESRARTAKNGRKEKRPGQEQSGIDGKRLERQLAVLGREVDDGEGRGWFCNHLFALSLITAAFTVEERKATVARWHQVVVEAVVDAQPQGSRLLPLAASRVRVCPRHNTRHDSSDFVIGSCAVPSLEPTRLRRSSPCLVVSLCCACRSIPIRDPMAH
jgi:hypothetical protein